MRARVIIYDDAKEITPCPFNENLKAILVDRDLSLLARANGVDIFLSTEEDDKENSGYHHIVMADDTPQAAVDSALSALEYAIHRGHDRLWIHQD